MCAAAAGGHTAVVKILMKECDLCENCESLKLAAASGHNEVVKLLVVTIGEDHQFCESYGRAIVEAAIHGHAAVVGTLASACALDSGVPYYTNPSKSPPDTGMRLWTPFYFGLA